MKKTGIITISFNNSKLIWYQIKCVKKYCIDNYELIVVDNGNNNEESKIIKNICDENNIRLINTNITSNSPSNNHGLALNQIYKILKEEFDYLLFLDHDVFPIKPFSVTEILEDNMIAGQKQIRGNNEYLWPGLLFINKLNVDLDFTPLGNLDTGGKLSKLVSENKEKIFFIEDNRIPIDLELNNNHMHEFYQTFQNETFIHFIKSSNWCNVNEEIFNTRLNFLFNKLDNYIKINLPLK